MPASNPLVFGLAGATPHIETGAWIAPGAVVVGQVRLRSGSSIWYGAVVRGDEELIEVGAGSNVQDNCVVHADAGMPVLIGANVTIGHNATVHGARIGDGVLVGVNAVLLNGCVIGAGSTIGAGAVLAAGTQVPPRSLVMGVPGKVRRELTDDEVGANLANARDYVLIAQRHRSQSTMLSL